MEAGSTFPRESRDVEERDAKQSKLASRNAKKEQQQDTTQSKENLQTEHEEVE